jgi:hypothetical protein
MKQHARAMIDRSIEQFPPAWHGLPEEERDLFLENDLSSNGSSADTEEYYADVSNRVARKILSSDGRGTGAPHPTRRFRKWYFATEGKINGKKLAAVRMHRDQRRANRRYLSTLKIVSGSDEDDWYTAEAVLESAMRTLFRPDQIMHVPESQEIDTPTGGGNSVVAQKRQSSTADDTVIALAVGGCVLAFGLVMVQWQ